MIHLVLVRHAQAEHAGPAQTDAERALTKHGLKDAARTADAIAAFDLPRPLEVLSSPKVRAFETARIIAARLEAGEPRKLAILKGDHDPARILRELHVEDGVASVVVVGHMPDLGYLLARMVRPGDGGAAGLPTAGYAWLELDAIPPVEPPVVRKVGRPGE